MCHVERMDNAHRRYSYRNDGRHHLSQNEAWYLRVIENDDE